MPKTAFQAQVLVYVTLTFPKAMRRHGLTPKIPQKVQPHPVEIDESALRLNSVNTMSRILNSILEKVYITNMWRQGKQVLLVSEYYRTFADMCNAVITYYRTS